VPFNCPVNRNTSIKRFDALLSYLMDICANYGSRLLPVKEAEQLWLSSLDKIYLLGKAVTDTMGDSDDTDQEKFSEFLTIRIQSFMVAMSEHVHLQQIIEFLQGIGKQTTYQEFQPTLEEKVKKETYHEKILRSAKGLQAKDLLDDFRNLDNFRVSSVHPVEGLRGQPAPVLRLRHSVAVTLGPTANPHVQVRPQFPLAMPQWRA
jgi:hypothetical protein